jgi:hypothetical protein
VIDGLLSLNTANITVFVCVRTTLYELGESRYEAFLPDDYIPFDLNKLSNDDVRGFVSLFSNLGLWGTRAALSDTEKENFVKVECSRGISNVILSIFEKSEVGDRITLLSKLLLNEKSDTAALIILSFLMNRIGHPPRLSTLSEILNIDVWKIVKSPIFTRAGEFIHFKDGHVKARSSIVSSYLLRKSLKPELLIWHIEKFVRRLGDLKRDRTLHHIFTELHRFPVLESLIEDSPRKREIIIGYFQSIKDLPNKQRNALFWLHYAMARLSFGEFKEAALYFEQARSYAKGSPQELIEVNNHFARLLLDSRTNSDDYNDYFEAFEMAHGILIEQINKGANKHFPFRQAKKYVEFISFRKKDLSNIQISRFVTSCGQVISAIKHLDGPISRSREVTECQEAIERALAIAR